MKNLSIILIILLVGCTTKQQVSYTKFESKESLVIEAKIVENNKIVFSISNNTSESLNIYQPQKLNIEMLVNDSWEKLRILPCPCDAPCNASIEKEVLAAEASFNLNWNKEESWCGLKRVNNVRETIKKTVGKGTYRIKINILNESTTIKAFYHEFIID